MTKSDLSYATIKELGQAIQSGALKPVEITEYLLDRIERLNMKLHAFITLTPERAQTEAKEDAALVCDAIQGEDRYDDATLRAPRHDILNGLYSGVADLKIAFGESVFFDDVDSEVEQAVRAAGDVLNSLGAHVTSIEIPGVEEVQAIPDRFHCMASEAYFFNKGLLEEHADVLDPIVLWMTHGKNVTAPDYFALLRHRAQLKLSVCETLRDIDVLLVPTVTTPTQPTRVVDASAENYSEYQQKYVRNATLGNFLDFCGVSIPCGFSSQGLPIGLMVYAKPLHYGWLMHMSEPPIGTFVGLISRGRAKCATHDTPARPLSAFSDVSVKLG